MVRKLLRAAAFAGIAAYGFAWAQEGATPSAPAIQLPQVQTPTITNTAPALQAPQARPAAAEPAAAPAPDTGPESNDFQDFIAQSIGQRLPLYGYNLFQRAPSTSAPKAI